MKKKLPRFNIYCLTLLFAISTSAQSIVETHGRLRVQGNQIVDQSLNPTSIAGNSLFWSNAGDSADYYNAQTVNFLADNWDSSVVRCAMGVNEPWDGGNGYINSPVAQEAKIRRVIDAAIQKGIYVIIDWHTHEAELYEEEAIEFFTKMARIYGDQPNVIYEIYNEPVNQSWSTIKNYAEAVIQGIRSEDSDNLIIVGTPFYSQDVDVASTNPIDDINTAYTLHFYAGTHGNDLRNKATTAMNNGVALFVTEWGSVNADGRGNPDVQSTETWMQFLQDNNLSHANWAVSDKSEGASIVQTGAGLSGLINNQLTDAGLLLRDIIQNWNSDSPEPDPTPTEPGTVNCNSIDCIRNAMASAQPGDEIVVASGTYRMTDKIDGAFGRNSYLYASANGNLNNPIILRGANPANPPVIEGIDYLDGYLLSIDGNFWVVKDMEFMTGSKGIMLDNANNVQIMDVSVHDIGDEAIHFRDGSSNNLVDGCTLYDTGKRVPGFGEGLYVGSDKGQHDQYNPECNDNTIQNSIIGPNIAAEGADIKEGTENTIIRNCVFSAKGISGENSADAFIDLKGAYAFVYNNTFNLDGSTVINAGIDFLDRGTDFNTGFRNAIFSNTFNLGNRAQEIPTARRKQGSPQETHVWDNIRTPQSPDFPISNGTIDFVSQFCPEWNILPCSVNSNQFPTVSFTNPIDNVTLTEGYDILEVSATASDSDGTIVNVGLYIDDVLIRNNSTAPYEWGVGNNLDETLNLEAGSYTFKVIAMDNEGALGEATFVLTVTDDTVNQAPAIAFTTPSGDITVEEGYNLLEVSATASDTDGTIANVGLYIDDVLIRTEVLLPYEWGKDTNIAETLGLEVGRYTFKAIATDNEGATGEATFVLTVTDDTANQAPIIAFTTPSGDITVEESYNLLEVLATVSDSDGTIVNVGLYIDDVLIRNNLTAPYEWGVGSNLDETLNLEPGTYTFKAIATDNDGATGEATFVLTVTDDTVNLAPIITFTTPSGDITVEEGYNLLEVSATASDSDGTIVNVGLYIDDVLIRNNLTAPYEWGVGNNLDETLNLEPGTYTFKVIATDNDGATAEDVFVLTVEKAQVSTEEKLIDIKVYPNPTTDQFFIYGLPEDLGLMTIVDMSGNVVLNLIMTGEEGPIDISNLSSATYIITVIYQDAEISKKLVIE